MTVGDAPYVLLLFEALKVMPNSAWEFPPAKYAPP